jgi:ligand-binding sensor domain-containing protein
MFIFSTGIDQETLAREDVMFNKIKFATGLMVMVVMTVAMFGLSLKSRNINGDQSLNNLAPSRSSEVVMSTAVAKERLNYGPDTNPVSEEQVYDDDLFTVLASGVVSDTEDLAALDSFDFGTVRDVKIDGDRVLLATAGGVIEFYPEDSSFLLYSDRQGLTDHDCYALTVDDGEIYVGTSNGVYYISECGEVMPIWREITDTITVIKSFDSRFYVGTKSSGLFVSNWDTIDQILPAKSVVDVARNAFGLWVLTADAGLLNYQGDGWKRRYLKSDSTALAAANCLYTAFQQPWLGTQRGAYFFNGGIWTLVDSSKGLFDQNVTAIAKGATFAYIGTAKGGVFSYYDGALSPLDWSEGLEVAALDVLNGAYLVGLQKGGAIFKPAKGESYNILDIIRKTGAVFTGI